MGRDVKVGLDLVTVTATGGVTFSDASSMAGDTPKGAVFLSVCGGTNETESDHAQFSFGFTNKGMSAGPGTQHCVLFHDEDDVGSGDGGDKLENNVKIAGHIVPGTNVAEASLQHSAVSADTFSAKCSKLDGPDMTVISVMFGGADCGTYATQIAFDATTKTVQHNLDSKNILVFMVQNSDINETPNQNECRMSWGFGSLTDIGGTPATWSKCYGSSSDVGDTTMDLCARIGRDDQIGMTGNSGATSWADNACDLTTTNVTSNSFELAITSADNELANIFVVGTGDCKVWAGEWAAPTTTTSDWSAIADNSLDFKPQAIGIVGTAVSAQNLNRNSAEANPVSLGVAVKTGREYSVGYRRENGSGDMVAKQYFSNDSFLYTRWEGGSGSGDVYNHAQNPTFTSSGFLVAAADLHAATSGDIYIGWAIEEGAIPASAVQIDLVNQSFTVAANAITFKADDMVSFNSSTFSFQGNAVSQAVATLIELNAQAFSFAANAIVEKANVLVDLTSSAFNYATQAVNVTAAQVVALGVGAFNTAAQQIGTGVAVTVQLLSSAFTYTAKALSTNFAEVLSLNASAFNFTQRALATNFAEVVALGVGAFNTSAKAITSGVSYTAALGVAAFNTTAKALETNFGTGIALSSAAFTLTSKAITILSGQIVELGAATFTMTTQAVSPVVDAIVRLSTAAFNFSVQSVGTGVEFKKTVVRMGMSLNKFWRRG